MQTMSSLQQCSELLDQEEQADAQMRAKYGERWVRPQSNILTSALRETIGRYQANLATAGESDARVLSKLEANRGRLESLSAEGARSLVPTLQQPMVVPGVSHLSVNQLVPTKKIEVTLCVILITVLPRNVSVR